MRRGKAKAKEGPIAVSWTTNVYQHKPKQGLQTDQQQSAADGEHPNEIRRSAMKRAGFEHFRIPRKEEEMKTKVQRQFTKEKKVGLKAVAMSCDETRF